MSTSQERWADIVRTVLRNKRKPVADIVAALEGRYGELGEVIGGDELYPAETTWYFKYPTPTEGGLPHLQEGKDGE